MTMLLSLSLIVAAIAFAHAIHCRWRLDRLHAAIGAQKRVTDYLTAGQANVEGRVKALESKVQDGWTIAHEVADTLIEHKRLIDGLGEVTDAILLADEAEQAELEAACDEIARQIELKKAFPFHLDPKFGRED